MAARQVLVIVHEGVIGRPREPLGDLLTLRAAATREAGPRRSGAGPAERGIELVVVDIDGGAAPPLVVAAWY